MFLPVFVSQGFCGHLGKDTIDGVALASTVRQKHLGVFYFKNQFYTYSRGVELIPHVHTLDAGLHFCDVLYNHLYHLITYFTKLLIGKLIEITPFNLCLVFSNSCLIRYLIRTLYLHKVIRLFKNYKCFMIKLLCERRFSFQKISTSPFKEARWSIN